MEDPSGCQGCGSNSITFMQSLTKMLPNDRLAHLPGVASAPPPFWEIMMDPPLPTGKHLWKTTYCYWKFSNCATNFKSSNINLVQLHSRLDEYALSAVLSPFQFLSITDLFRLFLLLVFSPINKLQNRQRKNYVDILLHSWLCILKVRIIGWVVTRYPLSADGS